MPFNTRLLFVFDGRFWISRRFYELNLRNCIHYYHLDLDYTMIQPWVELDMSRIILAYNLSILHNCCLTTVNLELVITVNDWNWKLKNCTLSILLQCYTGHQLPYTNPKIFLEERAIHIVINCNDVERRRPYKINMFKAEKALPPLK